MALQFDPEKSFEENCAEFQRHLVQLDPECAQIFLEAKEKLLGDGIAVAGSRPAFNRAVLEKLRALPSQRAGD